jgi:hypothetical protein
MGGKRKRQRQYILLFPAACLLLLMMAGCGPLIEPHALPDRKDQSSPVPVDSEKEAPSARHGQPEAQHLLDQAEVFLEKGKPANALAVIEKVIVCCEGQFPERTLRIMTDALTSPDSHEGRRNEMIQRFLQLEASSPASVYGPAAGSWVAALKEVLAKETEIRNLKQTIQSQKRQLQVLERQIEQLKAVDLELESPDHVDEVP